MRIGLLLPKSSHESPSSSRPGTPCSFTSTAPTSLFPDTASDSGLSASELLGAPQTSPELESCASKQFPAPQATSPLILCPQSPIPSTLTCETLSSDTPQLNSLSPQPRPPSPEHILQPRPDTPKSAISPSEPTAPQPRPASPQPHPIPPQPRYGNPFGHVPSNAAQEWERRKRDEGEVNDVIDELMRYEGLEEVKQQFLDIKSKVDVCKNQRRDLKQERFNIIFQGNPGTGKTTIARLYAKFLHSVGVLKSKCIKETSGIKVASKGSMGIKRKIKNMLRYSGGGVLFIDEAYQLTAPYMDGTGRQALDIILASMENNIGKLVVIFVGYKDEMESFFEHNPGLASRIPYNMNFADFTDAELWKILYDNIHNQYKGNMKVERGMDGLYMRVVVRRLAQCRGSRGFGNARAVQNLLASISQRQAQRLRKEKTEGKNPDYLLFTKEDLIGPDPSRAAGQSAAWAELQKLIGLDSVKECAQSMIRMIQLNYHRELAERKPLKFSLNQLFVGAPGTGKTTVAKLYGQILADLGLLSRCDVVLKNPSDFIGECLGKSEAKTRKILEATVGKVLVIDEAYMLDAGDPNKEQDKFKTGVIDTLVAIVQGVPGEDRCIILVGYEDKISDMFHNVNPGLSRRFPIQRPFRFENFNLPQLQQIMQLKMHEQDIDCTPKALEVAGDVLERALMRPNFTNAGEVESCLATAKMNYEMRQSRKPFEDQAFDGMLEPEDFDRDFNRGSRTEIDCRKALNGLVHESIIEKLVSYQSRCLGARRHGLNPRDQVPTNFIFKGFPGTGKTTTAQHMGQIFYNMGFLSTPEVVECSATDLLGQYVGQTAPKTRKQLEKALGKVLFIDEAYRLIYGQYAAEAVDELIQFFGRPSHAGKMVVILAGYTADMNLLMSTRPVFSGLFPEEIVFENLRPEDCITLLLRELEHNQIVTESNFLRDSTSEGYLAVRRLFHAMQLVPSWSNARDVKYLAKQMLGKFLESMVQENQQARTLSLKQVTDCMMQVIMQRRDRCVKLGANDSVSLPLQPSLGGNDAGLIIAAPQQAPPPIASDSVICTPEAGANCFAGTDVSTDAGYSDGQRHTHQPMPSRARESIVDIQSNGPNIYHSQQQSGSHEAALRERGASDAEWSELQSAKVLEQTERQQHDARLKQLQRDLRVAEAAFATGNGDDIDRLTAKLDSIRDELSSIQKLMQDKEKVQQALQAMNRCVYGYCWTRVAGGYRCEGGMHFIANNEIRDRVC